MNSDDKDTPKGFAGLEDMVSKLDEPCESSARETVQQKQARQNKLENERQRNMEPVNGPN